MGAVRRLLAVLWCLLASRDALAAEDSWSRRADLDATQGDWIPLSHGQPQPFHQARLLQPQLHAQFLNQQFHQPLVGGWKEEQDGRPAGYVPDKTRVSEYTGVRQQLPNQQQKQQVQILYVPVETLRQRSRGQKELVKQSSLNDGEEYPAVPESRHQVPAAERLPTVPTGQRELQANKNTPQRLAQQIPTPNIPETAQPVSQQPYNTPHILAHPNLATQHLALQNVGPQNLVPQNLAPQNLASQNLAPQNLTPQKLAPQNLAPHNLAPQNLVPQNLASHNVAEQFPQNLDTARPQNLAHQVLQGPQYFQQPTVAQTPIPTLIQLVPPHQQQSVPKPKEKAKEPPFRHPIQPLKEQMPGNVKVTKISPEYYDSIKETSQSVLARDQLYRPYMEEQLTQSKLKYEELASTARQEVPNQKQMHRHQPEESSEQVPTNTKEQTNENSARPWYDNFLRNKHQELRQRYEQSSSQAPANYQDQAHQFYQGQSSPGAPNQQEERKSGDEDVNQRHRIQQKVESELPPPNQPPLSVYMETGPHAKVGDLLSLLHGASTIPVLDSIGPDSPQVFVGPSNLKTPHGYVKFELPYLSSLDGNRLERKVLQLPFFVAPLNFQPPPGYAKIPFPPPHIGSVVLSNVSASLVGKEPQVKLISTTDVASTNREPYAIPADISSISPHLPSLINSLQEEQDVTTNKPDVIAETEVPKKPAVTRRPVYRGSQRGYSTTSSTSSPRRNYGHRRRPYNRNYSRQQTTEATTLNTDEQQQLVNQQVPNSPNLNQDELPQKSYQSVYANSKTLRRPSQRNEDEKETNEYQTTVDQLPAGEPNRFPATFRYVTTTEQGPPRTYQFKQSVTTRPAAGLNEYEELAQSTPAQELKVPYTQPQLLPEQAQTERPPRPVYRTENIQPTSEQPQRETYHPEFSAYNEGIPVDFKQKYHPVSSLENEDRQRVAVQYPTTPTPTIPVHLPDTVQYSQYDLKPRKESNDFYNVQDVPPNPTVRFPEYQTVTEHLKPAQVSEDNESRLQNHRLQTDKVLTEEPVEYKTETPFKQTTSQQNKARNRLRARLYTSRLRTTTQPSAEKVYDYSKRDETTESPKRTNNLRSRRPSRPLITTTSAAPVTTTTAPPGTKYLIRTRRPINGQTKLKVSRSRIRRPTSPTTSTTTTAYTTTTTENPFANYNVQLNQQQQYYDSLQETTPFSNRYVIGNVANTAQSYDVEGQAPSEAPDGYYKQDEYRLSTKLPKEISYYEAPTRQKEKNVNANYWAQNHKTDDYVQHAVHMESDQDLYEPGKRQKENTVKEDYWTRPAVVKQSDYVTTTPKQEQQLYYEQQSLRHKDKITDGGYWEENLKEYEKPSRIRGSSTENPLRRQKVKQKEWPAVQYQPERSQTSDQLYENPRRHKVAASKVSTEAPLPRVKFTELPQSSKDGQDFWNQAVTIQQSKSYEYNPDVEDSALRKTTAGTPQEDYFYDDQSPFPSNEQKITYVGAKLGVERGKQNQYAVQQQLPSSTEAPQLEVKATDLEHSNSSIQTDHLSADRKAGRKRGSWVKVRVKKTKDMFETAESQRFGSLVSNSLQEPIKEVSKTIKTDDKIIENDSLESNTSVDNVITESTTEHFPSTTSFEFLRELESTTMSEEGTEPSTTNVAVEESTYLATALPETPLPKVLATSTTTEVTLETEICYRGRCVKTKRSRPTSQQQLLSAV